MARVTTKEGNNWYCGTIKRLKYAHKRAKDWLPNAQSKSPNSPIVQSKIQFSYFGSQIFIPNYAIQRLIQSRSTNCIPYIE